MSAPTIAIVVAVVVVLGHLLAFSLCRAAKEADDAMDSLYHEAGTELFDR